MGDLLQLKKVINSFNKVSLLSFRDTLSSLLNTDDSDLTSFIINKLQMSKNAKLKKEIVHAIIENPKVIYIPILLQLLEQETDSALVNVVCKALIATESKDAIEGMKEIAKKRTTASAIKAIENHIKKTSSTEPIEFYVKNIFKGSSDAKSSLHAVNVLLRLGSEKILPELYENLKKTNDYMAINNALSVINGFEVNEERVQTLIEFLHKNIENFHKINKLTKVIEALFKEEKDKILSIAVNGLAIYGTEDEKKLKKFIESGEKQKGLKIAEEIVKSDKDFFIKELSNYISLLLENRVTEAKVKLEQFEKKVSINKKLQSSIVYNNFAAVAKYPTKDLISFKERFLNQILDMLKSKDEQVASGAATLAGACFEEKDEEILQLIKSSKVTNARMEFVKEIGLRKNDVFYNILLEMALNDKSLDVRGQAILSISNLPSVKNNIDQLINSPEIEKIIIGIKVIKEQKFTDFADKLSKMIENQSDKVVSEIFDAFLSIGNKLYYEKVKDYIGNGKSNINRIKAIKLLPVLDPETSITDLFKLTKVVKELELKASIIEALHEALFETNLSDMDNIRTLLDLITELSNSENYLKVAYEVGPLFNVSQKLFYAKLKETFENKLSQLRHAPKWDKLLLASLEVAIKDCNQKMFELDEIKEIGNKVKHFLLKLKNESDNNYLMQIVTELREFLINQIHLIEDNLKNNIFDDLFSNLEKVKDDWKVKRIILETIGEVLKEDNISKLKNYLVDSSRAVRVEAKKAILKTGLEPEEVPSKLFKNIVIADSSKFFKNKIYNYIKKDSSLFSTGEYNIINFEGNEISDDNDLYIVDDKGYETLKLSNKKCFAIVTYTIMANIKKEDLEKKGVILLQKPFVMNEIDKKIISLFK